MSEFRKYMHVERFGNDEVQGIELGECYIFPKLDGTNASVWWDENGVHCGSRTREISTENDNAGFCAYVNSACHIADFFVAKQSNKNLTIYGEWLVPHTLKTYRQDVWRRFWVFDVWDNESQRYLPYNVYGPYLYDDYGFDVIPPLCVVRNATYDNLLVELDKNQFLISDGSGAGEGIVIKNYNYANKFGRTTWAKIVRTEFKEKHVFAMGPTVKNMKEMVEQEIVHEFVTKALVDKVYAKIVNEHNGWNSRRIPQLLETVYYDLVNEECWAFVKKHKRPTVNFKTLYSLCVMRVKQLKSELF